MDVLRGDRVVLRPFREDDAADVASGCADPVTQRFLPHLPSPYTIDDARWWIGTGAPAAVAAGHLAYGFADPTTDRIIGGGGVSRGTDAGEVGYWVAPPARGAGVATEATRLLVTQAFAGGVHRVVLHTHPENLSSQRVAIKAGFTREGIARGAGQGRDGSAYDKIVWARLATDPPGPSRRTLPDLPGPPGNAGELTDGVVSLRALTSADADDTYALRILPECVLRSVPPVEPDRAEVERRCAQAASMWLAGVRADLTIRDVASGVYAGEIGLYYAESGLQQAMIGYSVTREWRGRGYATRAVNLLVGWAFVALGVARVIAGTAPDNAASHRVLARAGFVREAYMRDRLPGPGDTRIDDIQWVRLRARHPDHSAA
jgi:RimJ/RimL family protein N-acetyltransferase